MTPAQLRLVFFIPIFFLRTDKLTDRHFLLLKLAAEALKKTISFQTEHFDQLSPIVFQFKAFKTVLEAKLKAGARVIVALVSP